MEKIKISRRTTSLGNDCSAALLDELKPIYKIKKPRMDLGMDGAFYTNFAKSKTT